MARTITETPAEALARIQSGMSDNDAAVVMLFAARGIDPDQIIPRENVLTFHAWKAKGRSVMKGEKAERITTWIPCGPRGNEELDADGQPRSGRKMRPKTAFVFHISQTQPMNERRPDRVRVPVSAPAIAPERVAIVREIMPAVKVDRPAGDPERAGKLRTLADGMQAGIDERRRPMTQNPTPKRNKEYRSRLHDADNMERGQLALRALAAAHEAGTCPAILASLKTKAQIVPLMHKGITGQGGYYDVIPSDKYSTSTPEAVALQQLTEGAQTPEQQAAQADAKRESEISRLEADALLSPIPGFVPTPEDIVARMIYEADIPAEAGCVVLEPSAGTGRIADAVRSRYAAASVSCYEINHQLAEILRQKAHNVDGGDFLASEPLNAYADRVLMNPPFEKGQDIDHVRHAFRCTKPGGRIVAIMSAGTFSRSDRKATEFREWLDSVGGTSEQLDADAFKSSGTGVSTRLVVIDRPQDDPVRFDESDTDDDTPAMRQYRRFKEQHPGSVLFFRMGDFYELFADDAELAHRTLGITLTRRGSVPMAGVPYHAVEGYLRRMIQAGHRCAVCEQTTDPRPDVLATLGTGNKQGGLF